MQDFPYQNDIGRTYELILYETNFSPEMIHYASTLVQLRSGVLLRIRATLEIM